MPWHTFRLSSQQIAAGEEMRVLDVFTELYTKAGGPPDVALFTVPPSEHDFATYYLTPATEQQLPVAIRVLKAQPGQPPPANASQLVGVTGRGPSSY